MEKTKIDTSGWENAFLEVYPSCEVTIEVLVNKIKVSVHSQYQTLPINFGKLMGIGKVFGTLDFEFDNRHEHESWNYSWTGGSEDDYYHEFIVEIDKLNTGLPWEKNGS